MSIDTPPTDSEILAVLTANSAAMEPEKLVSELLQENELDDVIEALQRALERGVIAFDEQGLVANAAELFAAA